MKLRFFLPTFIFALTLASCDVFFSFGDGGVLPTNTMVPTTNPTGTQVADVTQTAFPAVTTTPIPVNPTPTQKTPKPTSTPLPNGGDGPGDHQNKRIFDLQPGSPTRIHAWSHDCSWLGVAGQVFNKVGQPVEGLIIEAGGNLGGQNILGLSITGFEDLYGPGGYEIKLWEQPVLSTKSVWIQLKDSSGGLLSEKVFLDTVDDCNQNLTILNFVEVDPLPASIFYFPLVRK